MTTSKGKTGKDGGSMTDWTKGGKSGIAPVLIAMVVFLAIDFAVSSATWLPGARAVSSSRTFGGITGRTRNHVGFEIDGTWTSLTGLLSFEVTRDVSLEMPERSWEQIEIGRSYSWEELNEMRGRSLAGRAWDLIKKPRRDRP